MSCPGASTSKDEDRSSDSSEDTALARKKRELPHSVFAHALTSTRLRSGTRSSFDTLYGNPNYGNILRLYCKTRWYLTISMHGEVYGVQDENNTYGIFEITSAGEDGHVRIKAIQSNMYMAFNAKGRLYGEVNKNLGETVWMEELLGSYNTYLSRSYAHLGWYLGLKKSGNPKRGNTTEWGQNSIKFLPIRVKN